jgi:hypothetical protein
MCILTMLLTFLAKTYRYVYGRTEGQARMRTHNNILLRAKQTVQNSIVFNTYFNVHAVPYQARHCCYLLQIQHVNEQ